MTKIKQILISRDLEQQEVIEQINKLFPANPTNKDAFSRIVNGNRKNIKLSTILRICAALQVTPNDIIEYEHFIK